MSETGATREGNVCVKRTRKEALPEQQEGANGARREVPPRRSASCLPTTCDSDTARLSVLLDWARQRDIWIHDAVSIGCMPNFSSSQPSDEGDEIVKSSRVKDHVRTEGEAIAEGSGFGIYVRPGHLLLPRQVVVLVPKTTMFSCRTASLAPLLAPEQLFDADAASGLLLTTLLLHEFLLGSDGPWWGYLQSLPRELTASEIRRNASAEHSASWGIDLPLNWDREGEAWRQLYFTECGRMVRRAESDCHGRLEGIGMNIPRMRGYFAGTAMPLLQRAFPDRTLDSTALWPAFVSMQSIISSRSFVVDMYHGLALVPIADMFNHEDDPNVHFEADDEVCDECGALGSCPHNDDPLPASGYGRPSAFIPAESGPNSVGWRPPAALDGVDTVDLVAQEHIIEHSEAFNNYGNLSNSVLLATYGFCLPEETRWERYGWEWRFAEERDEILHAFGLQEELHGGASGKKRPFDALDTLDTADSFLPQRKFLLDLGKLLADWTTLPAADFREVYNDPITVLQDLHNESGSPAISLPVDSPWTLLADSDDADVDEGDGDEDENDDTTSDDVPQVSVLFAPLSRHDGSRDRYQPLFIDVCGRVSFPLWRASLFAARLRRTKDDPSTSCKEDFDPLAIEKGLDLLYDSMASDMPSHISTLIPSTSTTQLALASLLTLVNRRLDRLRLSSEQARLNASSQFKQCSPGPLRSALALALQEANALATCSRRLDQLHAALPPGKGAPQTD